MQNKPVQQTVLEIVQNYTKSPVNMGSKLKQLNIYPLDREFLRADLEDAFGIEIEPSEATQWKKVKNIVANVNLLIHRLG